MDTVETKTEETVKAYTELFPDPSTNIVIDYDSLRELEEPPTPIMLSELDLERFARRMISELESSNWLYIEFEDNLRMLWAQREAVMFRAGSIAESYLNKEISKDLIEKIRTDLYNGLVDLSERESEPGVYGDAFAASIARVRLRSAATKEA